MTLDLGTLAVAIGISMVVRVAATTVQFVINRAYRGIGLWAVGSACAAGGFAIMFARSMVAVPPVFIVIQNGLLVVAILFEYLGTMAFLGRAPRSRMAWGGYLAFVAALAYFTFMRDDMVARTVLVHGALAVVTLSTAWNMWSDRRRAIRQSTRFMGTVLLLSGGYFALHSLVVLVGGAPDNMGSPTFLQLADLFVALIGGNLLTYGLIIMVGQRLHADVMEAKQRFELLFNTSPDASLVTRLDDGAVVSVNDGFAAITGYTRDEIIGRSTIDSLWDDAKDRSTLVAQLAAHGSFDNLEAVFRRKDGSRFVGMVSSKAFALDGVTHAISVIRDISGRKALENELTIRATTDGLTGVANRSHFMELALSELNRAQRHKRPLSIVLLDIDRFKRVNDTCGHLSGDTVLTSFTGVCQDIIRSIDVVARFGGDEFVLLLPETEAAGAREVAERIRVAFAAMTFGAVGCGVMVTASLGVATLREGDESLDVLLGRADMALYRAKERGRNRVEDDSADE